jgi:isoamylase
MAHDTKDFTGVGNTLNANHPVVRQFVMLVLRYWAMQMHVDGFRFAWDRCIM